MSKLDLDKTLKLFPLDKPREIQQQAIKDAVEAYNRGAEYVVCEVPTGGGKSGIAVTLARAMGESYMLTLTEQLQKQYLRDFKAHGLEELLGRGKFRCYKGGGTCADGKHLYTGRNKCEPTLCPYQVQKVKALNAPHIVANYHSYLYNVGLAAGRKQKSGAKGRNKSRATVTPDGLEVDINPEHFAGDTDDQTENSDFMRDLTVIDEAHAAEGFLLDVAGLSVKLDKLTFPLAPLPHPRWSGDDEPVGPYIEYIKEELLPKLTNYIEVSTQRGILDPKTKDELGQLMAKLNMVLANPGDSWIPERMETRERKGDRTNNWFALKPLRVDRYGRWLHGFGRRLLLMSGTVLSGYHLVTSLGLDPSRGEIFTYDSPFPVENRPVFVGNLDMSFKARDESWPLMMQMLKQLLEAHANEKGLILCTSNVMMDHIAKEMMKLSPLHARRLIKASGEDRVEQYNLHLRSASPSVLMASGYWEGADLKGNASRFQIIPAVPRPMWNGQIKARAAKEKGWYAWMTYTKMLQGLGRSVRDMDDTAVTYIFDRDFRAEYARGDSGLIPKWVRSSVQLID